MGVSIIGNDRWENKRNIPIERQQDVMRQVKAHIDRRYPEWCKRTKCPKKTFVIDYFIMQMEKIEFELDELYKQAWNEFVIENGDRREDGSYIGYID